MAVLFESGDCGGADAGFAGQFCSGELMLAA
jgi:hypothetical protein